MKVQGGIIENHRAEVFNVGGDQERLFAVLLTWAMQAVIVSRDLLTLCLVRGERLFKTVESSCNFLRFCFEDCYLLAKNSPCIIHVVRCSHTLFCEDDDALNVQQKKLAFVKVLVHTFRRLMAADRAVDMDESASGAFLKPIQCSHRIVIELFVWLTEGVMYSDGRTEPDIEVTFRQLYCAAGLRHVFFLRIRSVEEALAVEQYNGEGWSRPSHYGIYPRSEIFGVSKDRYRDTCAGSNGHHRERIPECLAPIIQLLQCASPTLYCRQQIACLVVLWSKKIGQRASLCEIFASIGTLPFVFRDSLLPSQQRWKGVEMRKRKSSRHCVHTSHNSLNVALNVLICLVDLIDLFTRILKKSQRVNDNHRHTVFIHATPIGMWPGIVEKHCETVCRHVDTFVQFVNFRDDVACNNLIAGYGAQNVGILSAEHDDICNGVEYGLLVLFSCNSSSRRLRPITNAFNSRFGKSDFDVLVMRFDSRQRTNGGENHAHSLSLPVKVPLVLKKSEGDHCTAYRTNHALPSIKKRLVSRAGDKRQDYAYSHARPDNHYGNWIEMRFAQRGDLFGHGFFQRISGFDEGMKCAL